MLIPQFGVRSYVLLTRPPLVYFHTTLEFLQVQSESLTARLACIRHAASVHPEPGSNSSKKEFVLTSVEHLTSELTLIC